MVVVVGALACNVPAIRPRVLPTPRPTRTPLPPPDPILTPTLLEPTSTPLPPSTWEQLMPGLEIRSEWIVTGGVNTPIEMTIVRVDPALFDLKVHYDSGNIARVSDWQARTGAVFLVNGGFFLPTKETLGLIVTDGQAYGDSFVGHGGMLSVSEGGVYIRSLAQFPYLPGEALEEAVQGRPMLLYPGRYPVQFTLSDELSRRTAVGQDSQGRLVFIVNDYGALSLYALRDCLADNDELDLWTAFNLDGGGSTGMALQVNGRSLLIESWSLVPSVVAVYPRP
jgi:exopolysaccharide biosynthesis protein